ncbi:MAG TPA: S53 family peptidase, partial [Trebonia sp.]|nr:S53 family peptidase [Trebonia sp.]
AVATASASSTGSPSGGSTTDCDSVATCYTPQQLQVAYGIKPLLDRGINGQGGTVVLPELAESRVNPPWVTDMRQDMAAFDSLYHLPAARMRVDSTLAGARSPWLAFGEEVLDVEMVHALAPGATLVILLLPTNSLDNTANTVPAAVGALRLGSTEGGVLSISAAAQIGGEHCVTRAQADSVNAALQTAASHTTGAWQAETAFGLADGTAGSSFQASGGGFSRLFSRPGYQDGVPGVGATRGVPDVSADASGHVNLGIVLRNGSWSMISNGGGTSASASIWAALIALADQYAGRHLGFVNPAIYQIARGPSYHLAFHDITTGNNTVEFSPKTIAGYRAAPGWDPVTGWGSPDAQVLVPLLARYADA